MVIFFFLGFIFFFSVTLSVTSTSFSSIITYSLSQIGIYNLIITNTYY
jgi:hypothetical protein